MATQTNNIWIQTNKRLISDTKRQLIEYDFAGSYGGSLNLIGINNIIDSALIEIIKLQNEVESLKEELKKK